MDLNQRKLTKSEWNTIEIPISTHETRITELIKKGYHNVNITTNYTASLLSYMKITSTEATDNYIYVTYLQNKILDIGKKHNLPIITKIQLLKNSLKKADIIRLENTDKQLETHINDIYEYIILNLLEELYNEKTLSENEKKREINDIKNKNKNKNKNKDNKKNKKDWVYYYYTIKTIIDYNIVNVNIYFKKIVKTLLSHLNDEVDIIKMVSSAYTLIEKNEYLLKYADETLYDHQKQLFTLCKQLNPKLVLYIAPTGTGKTLSPLGLSEGNKIIFVCAARHVGLALAKSAISAGKRIAFAFGCSDTDDIRLHYSSAKEYSRNKKTGNIEKVDNAVGDRVEIMICDIKSYIPAMNYMIAFNKKEELICYWDEPTITMDYESHYCHSIIQENWSKNIIPNIVLSSATLPHLNELSETISDFHSRFDNASIHEIVSYDCKKSIPIINREGYVEMPHYLFNDYNKIQEVVKKCQKYKSLLRYTDLNEAINFIMYINEYKHYITNNRYNLENHFTSFDTITMTSIKLYYLELLGHLNCDYWVMIYNDMIQSRTKKLVSNINIVTSDAYTLTDGPTIFLADNMDKIAQFCIQSSKIPDRVLKDIMTSIEFNTIINEKISVMEKNLEDGNKKDEHKEKKMVEGRIDPQMKTLMNKIEQLREQVKSVMLPSCFVPNTIDHIHKYTHMNNSAEATDTNTKNMLSSSPYTSDISEYNVEQIMLIDDIHDSWKLLLMMGIGVFAAHKSDRYTEIMKTLAQEQKLYLIIASTDYIYGTNYQFCHGYISKDLGKMSQEKCIQAMGRVGRNKLQHDYSIRFRDDELLIKLFQEEKNKPEITNMNKLFTSF